MRYFISILFIVVTMSCKIKIPIKKQFTEWKKNITFPSVNWPKKWFVIPCQSIFLAFMGEYTVRFH